MASFFDRYVPALFVLAAIVLVAPGDALAQGGAGQQQEQIQRQMEEREREREARFRQRENLPPAGLVVPELSEEPAPEDALCSQVERIEVEGASLLSAAEINKITAKYAGRCLTLIDIDNLLRDLTNAYIVRGYVTARAFVRSDQHAEGVFQVLVMEGKLEKILLRDGSPDDQMRIRMAFPDLEGKPLNLRTLEQGLDQLNRLPSVNATMDLAPGEEMGGSIVYITLSTSKTWRVTTSVDNSGQISTGEWQGSLSLEKDNMLGLGDLWSFTGSRDLLFLGDKKPLDDNPRGGFLGAEEKKMHGNYALSMYGSVPRGPWTLFLSLNKSYYLTYLSGQNLSYESTGTTMNFNMELSRLLHRDAVGKTTLALALGAREVNNYIEDSRLIASSYRLALLTASLRHSRALWGGSFSASLDYTRGVPWFGVEKQEGSHHDIPRTLFDKLAVSLSWYRPFAVGKQMFYGSLSSSGQMSDHTLYGSERLSLGSRYTVRGFNESSLSGENGGYARAELGWNLPWPDALRQGSQVQGVQVYAGYDAGIIIADKHDPWERGRMHGVSVGLRTLGNASLDITFSRALAAPEQLKPYGTEIYMSFSYTF